MHASGLVLEYLDGCPHLDANIDDKRTARYRQPEFFQQEETRRDKIRTDTRVSQPLASYAVDNLFFHINRVPQGASADQILAALTRYLVPGKPAFETRMLMHWSGPLSASFNIFHLMTTARDGKSIPAYVMEYFAEREPTLLDSVDADGLTPLAYAAQNDYGHFVEVLLAKGADPTSGGNDGLTPLHRAAGQGSAAAVRHLLDAGVDPLIKTWPVLIVYDSYEGWDNEYTEEEAEQRRDTPLASAFESDDKEVVQAFMPFIPPDEINECLHRVGAVDNVREILETGKAEVDCFKSGTTKLFWAAQARALDVIKLLLKHSADPNRRCAADPDSHYSNITTELPHPDRNRGPTPLHAFAGLDHYRRVLFQHDEENAAACLRVLIEAGADVDATMDGKEHSGQNMTPLHFAVLKTDNVIMDWGSMDHSERILTKLLLSAGANPNAKTKNGNTPLHLANTEKPRLLELLVKHGARINAVNAWGRSPLLEMIKRLGYSSSLHKRQPKRVEPFCRLLELGADVHLADDEGDTIFHHIMHSIGSFANPNFMLLIERLLRAGADLNRRNKKGHPPLWEYNGSRGSAVNNAGDEDLLRVLVDAGMDLNARDEKGRTFLWEVLTWYGIEIETIDKFIRLGADPGALTHDGRTLLHYAVEQSKGPQWFRHLILAGVRPDALGNDGDTVIHAVLRGPHMYTSAQEVLQVLIEAGALPLVKNAKGQSALHIVGALDKLKIVLNTPAFRGLGINEPDVDGYTPLHHAVVLGEEVVWSLLHAGADPAALAAGGVSPLHLAALSGRADVVCLLLTTYRDINTLETHVNLLGPGGRAPLHYACRSASPEVVWILLHAGADARKTDNKGLTPLHILAEFKPPQTSISRVADIVRMLQVAGADVNAKAVVEKENEKLSRTSTALDIAVEREGWDLVRGLIAHGAEPRDGHRQSVDFVLATDEEKAAEQAQKAQHSVPLTEDSSAPTRAARVGAGVPDGEGAGPLVQGQKRH